MEEKRKKEIAMHAVRKGLDYESLYYCDEMYNEDKLFMDDIWEYVLELRESGEI
ncbi:MAG: hypothetical protein GY793_11885 [Proteobacteria bacterium]|nr:hypothetical protein [Pseudomonadota bacterium]